MPRIPYVDLSTITDPEILEYLEQARREGTPRPESQAIRAHNPNVIRAFSQAWELTFRQGVLDHAIKELCRLYVSRSVECEYCTLQRSTQVEQKALLEAKYDELLNFMDSDRFTEREKAALAYTSAILWGDGGLPDDELWAQLYKHFTVPEIVELGFFVALTFGQQRWIKTLGIKHGEFLADTTAGLSEEAARQVKRAAQQA